MAPTYFPFSPSSFILSLSLSPLLSPYLHAVKEIVVPVLSLELDAQSLLLGPRLDQLENLMVFVGDPNAVPWLVEPQTTIP